MRICVCVKQVPDTTNVEIDPGTGTLVREGVESVLNPLDVFAVEAGLRVRDAVGGAVTALSLGPPQAEEMLREVLAMGVDEAVLVTGPEFAGSDTWATSYALSRAIEALGGFDLIFCGKQAVDGDTGHVGPELAVHLGLPQATWVRRVRELTGSDLTVECLTDAGHQVLRLPLPAVLTVLKDIAEPRMPNLRSLRRARFAEVKRLTAQAIGAEPDQLGLEGSPTRVVRVFTPRSRRAGRIYEEDLERGLEEVADILAQEGRA